MVDKSFVISACSKVYHWKGDGLCSVNAKQMREVTPLHSAAHNGQTELVKLLIDNGADVNAETDDGQTPGHMAEEGGFYETVELIKRYNGQ